MTEFAAVSALIVGEKGPSGLERANWIPCDYEHRCPAVQVRVHADKPGPDRLN